MVLNEIVLLLKTADCAEKINERRRSVFSNALLEEHPEECGFGRIHEKVIAWAELPKPFIPNAKE